MFHVLHLLNIFQVNNFGCKLSSKTYGVIAGIFFDLSEPVLLGVSLEFGSVDGLFSSCFCNSE
jgi:hypothetical protein